MKRKKPKSTPRDLKKAMAAIVAICERHDIIGHIVLDAPGHTEFRLQLAASWSCMKMDHETGALRIRSQRDEYDSDEEQKKVVTDSISGILGIQELLENHSELLKGLLASLGEQFEIKHVSKRL